MTKKSKIKKKINLILDLQKKGIEDSKILKVMEEVDREIFELIENSKSLKKVFLWNTLVTSKEINNQNQKYEGIEIVGNLE